MSLHLSGRCSEMSSVSPCTSAGSPASGPARGVHEKQKEQGGKQDKRKKKKKLKKLGADLRERKMSWMT